MIKVQQPTFWELMAPPKPQITRLPAYGEWWWFDWYGQRILGWVATDHGMAWHAVGALCFFPKRKPEQVFRHLVWTFTRSSYLEPAAGPTPNSEDYWAAMQREQGWNLARLLRYRSLVRHGNKGGAEEEDEGDGDTDEPSGGV